MGYLTVFSESGVPHSGCILECGSRVEWLSFMPQTGSFFNVFPGGYYGMIDTTDRNGAIASYVRIGLPDDDLSRGRNETIAQYAAATYGLFINDCMTFSRSMIKNCGLSGGSGTSFAPGVLVYQLFLANAGQIAQHNTTPYPWKK